ncbi:hypothetical protein LV478_11595 [Komagataeibacter oboediens]|uniref:hypothetical protein n=1 Tax=Komagataeibacter oboediens TaxID=65958 RepID=UPI0023DA39EF|nr:hypothetical protein [Komagataeibacter oboediens]WEQ51173.1 hypothetical protein LV478_11595 [Komagataeibacter oboediens]
MNPTSDAAEPDYLATRLTWMEQVELHMRAHNSAPLNSRQRRRLRIARDNGVEPWDAFEQIVRPGYVQF